MQAKTSVLGRAFRRRRFLVNRRFQFRVGMMSATLTLLLLLFFNVSVYLAGAINRDAMARVAPELEELIGAQDQIQLILMIAGSLVFLGGVFVISILESHKTAGAAFNIERHLRKVQSGHYNVRLLLRKGDNLRELESAFNRMAESLRERTAHDAEVISALAARADSVAGGGEIAAELRRLADEQRARTT